MLDQIIQYSIRNKLIVVLFSLGIVGFGLYALSEIPIGAVPDVTNNQVQIITTSRNLATEDVEKFLTYPVELEMANLPGVKEIRSISKFGLSVVTVVFEDRIGTYLPRQLIAEKIKAAEEKIPSGFGKPFMGPITTGLGEIYQYVIEVDSAHRRDYTLSDLRTIQDWTIKRQLAGIPGVVEVNTWGGHLKQYEVAVNPEKLRSLDISLTQVFSALSRNNSIAGGGYIEKTDQTYFIRGEGLLRTTDDIARIVIETRAGTPVLVRDVATVGFGHATRFGAVTGNGKGEYVLGQVMMLKDANSKAVIEAVKARVAQISTSLPPGVSINPFLERSELIGKTSFTILENLILGCLIVIFVVILLLGNIRSGLVVASVIPLCLLFALSLMYIFGVDANLMSLGAIDFGIIIDGAVIIIEYIAFRISAQRASLLGLPRAQQQARIDEITHSGATKMMHSAVFGQVIIILVFIPILSLVGVEGKMFRPMALVFCFALLGAMLLCFTYVPVMASLFIRPAASERDNPSKRLIRFLDRLYRPSILWALRRKALVLGAAIGLLLGVFFLFTRMGGEFVPTLDEGDFVIQPVLKTGTTLTNTTHMTTRIEKILKRFPEVKQVVSRIGAAEVPTDPMSMEESDVIIKLLPQSEWTSATSKDALADTFKAALAEIPGVDFEFTQPIEMRFNELITGVRADLAIKIFGEDLDLLYKKALEVEQAIQGIEGAADITVEKVAGLPQISVQYDRQKIAKYGLNVEDLNLLVTSGFAGATAGTLFEGEKQFDLVLRFDPEHRHGIEDIEMASVQLPDGGQLPLSELATVRYSTGPAKISRDNTKRRIVIGVNVRNRDLESVVADVQQAIARQVVLPRGYSIDYGGQFENLRTARGRLAIAVPIALVLIFILLHFAFGSLREALIIYSAIPMSAVGGVLLLYLRDMPFSISAGVGFIALFGIAVLNGIVLIEEFRELKAHGVHNIHRRILLGTRNRLRPVLLTASAAAMGFLPMAISTSAGAEVQRPLATVVVGGLVSATLLTLIVLPVLYAVFDQRAKKKKLLAPHSLPVLAALLLGLGLVLPTGTARAQQTAAPVAAHRAISVEQAIEIALQRNAGLGASAQRANLGQQLVGTGIDIGKTEIYYGRDENNIAPNNLPLNVWGINQALQFPTVYGAQQRALRAQATLAQDRYAIDRQRLQKEVTWAYYEVVYWEQMQRQYRLLDSIYQSFRQGADRRQAAGETNYLEQLTAQTKADQVHVQLLQIRQNVQGAYSRLQQWMQADTAYRVQDTALVRLLPTPIDSLTHPVLAYYQDAILASQAQWKLARQRLLPDLNLTAFYGTNNGTGRQGYSGFQVGLAVPLWFGAQKARIASTRTEQTVLQLQNEDYRRQLLARYEALLAERTRHEQQLDFYKNTGKALVHQTRLHAGAAFRAGEIDYLEFVQLQERAAELEFSYLTSLYQYNRAVLDANYLIDFLP
ncbi:MAG: CusA/CzcA family heavy metal efflux RND transporter [Bacteroidetes bacterium]|nr:CusA/CzcA family heavy metal efflux RND transporter [Bacteroidota bacterium]